MPPSPPREPPRRRAAPGPRPGDAGRARALAALVTAAALAGCGGPSGTAPVDAAADAGPRDGAALGDGPGADASGRDGADAAAAVADDAVVVASDLPATLACGASYAATITVRNTGTATWTRAAGYKLGAVDDEDPFHPQEPRVELPDGIAVAPGAEHTFAVPLTAPATPGPRQSDWRMVHEGVVWFGAVASREIDVTCTLPVDVTTLDGKLLMGYQGWFACPGDGSAVDRWVHWFGSQTPSAASATTDLWPDTSELGAGETCATGFTLPGGAPAPLYSAFRAATVARHFRWMADHDLDGVWLQRFTSELGDPAFRAFRDQVAANVRAGAEAHGRAFALMYDISGMTEATLVDTVKADWAHVVDDLGLTASPRYLRHGGKPVLAIWGLGFSDRAGTAAQAAELIAWLKTGAPAGQRVTLMGGVPTHWRTLTGDSKTDAAWAAVYRSFDLLSPWSVGRYANEAGADAFRTTQIAPDLADATSHGIGYVPVVFPGFSWHNLTGDPVNQIPRSGGHFYWRQVYNAMAAGCTMIYGAMFDEVDEGTAMYKLAPSAATLPTQATYVPLDVDGTTLPSDWYLRVAGEATRMLRGTRPLTATLPLTP
jgi:hypothetical protein